MVTKWKNPKIAIGFLSFLLSLTAMCSLAVPGISAAFNPVRAGQYLNDAFAKNYQDTYRFKRAMSAQLEVILNYFGREEDDYRISNDDPGKNMLIQVFRAHELAYSDYGYSDLSNDPFPPNGYNFLLSFDGKNVSITKDNTKIDVYGKNRIYNPNQGMWYLPGYTNVQFTDRDTSDYKINILAKIQPTKAYGGNEDSGSLYGVIEYQSELRTVLYRFCFIGAAGILFFLLYFFLRKDKKQADFALARFSSYFWFEFKAFCLLCVAATDYQLFHGLVTFSRDSFLGDSWVQLGFAGIISIFCYYIIINDIRYNPKFYKNNCIHFFLSNYRKLENGKSVQKQLILRFWAFLGSEIGILLLFILILSSNRLDRLPGFFLMICSLILMFYLLYRYSKNFGNTVNEIGLLIDQISFIKAGNTSAVLLLPNDSDLNRAAGELNEIQSGIDTAIEERLKSERMKIDLITNVSHDIKTPLTSIIGYIDLLKQEEDLPDYIRDYVQVLAEKSDRLKNMVQDIFEVSKATSGNIELKMESLDLAKLLRQTLADMEERIEASDLTFKADIPEFAVMIYADGQRLYRVFQNLIENALQYSLDGSRIYVSLDSCNHKARAAIKNISQFELNSQLDMTERFVRGDHSRTDSGSGLGLSIAKSFTEACGGFFRIQTDADLFTAEVEFNQTS